jgi:aldose sugar dehydrogenase
MISLCLFGSHFTSGLALPKDNRFPIVEDPGLKVEKVLNGLEFPTQMAFLGPNDFLVIEKNNGKVLRVLNGSVLSKPLVDVNVANKNERGLLGLAIAKNLNTIRGRNDGQNTYATKIFLFYTYSDRDDNDNCHKLSTCEKRNDPKGNRLYRYELQDNHLVNPKLLLELPKNSEFDHNGGVIKIGPDNNVYLTSGDGDSCPIGLCTKNDLEGRILKSQTSNVLDGSPPAGRGGILRVTQNGSTVNRGILGSDDPLGKYYAYGIRNSFGIDFDPLTGKLWDTENGPFFGDEINLVEPGFNSGWLKVQGMWPVNTYNPHAYPNSKHTGYIVKDPINKNLKFNPRQLVDFDEKGVYSWPEFVWNQTVGPTAILFLNSDKLGNQYKNDLFVAESNTGAILHFELNKNRTSLDLSGSLADKIANNLNELEQNKFGEDFGLITDLKIGADGYLYVLSFDRGTVYRVIPSGD